MLANQIYPHKSLRGNRTCEHQETKVKQKRLEGNVEILGFLEENEKFATLKASKIFLFPSYEESWGISICEAMACGLPVMTYDLPVYRFFGNAMVKVPKGDVEGFANKALNLLSDEKLVKTMSLKAMSLIKHFDWDKIVEEESKLLQKIVTG